GPRAQRLDRALRAAVAGHDDTGQIGLDLVDLPDELEAVQARHPDVADDEIEAALREQRQRLGGIARLTDLMDARKDSPERTPIELLVIHDEDVRLCH